MKVKKPMGKGVKKLIEILVDLSDDKDVKNLQDELLKFKGGEEADPAIIFRNWTDLKSTDDVFRKIVKKVCIIIKDEMFE